jgi:hypothetical protein
VSSTSTISRQEKVSEPAMNPHARALAERQELFDQLITPAIVKEVFGVLVNLALEGKVPAMRLFLHYAVGRPEKTCRPEPLEPEHAPSGRKSSPSRSPSTPLSGGQPMWRDGANSSDPRPQEARTSESPARFSACAAAPSAAAEASGVEMTVRAAEAHRHQTDFFAPGPGTDDSPRFGGEKEASWSATLGLSGGGAEVPEVSDVPTVV